jgi:hypothetical protein
MAFYAQYDPTVTPVSPVIGWYDVQDESNPNGLVYGVMPPTAQLLAVTQDQWEARLTNPSAWAVEAGALVAATPVSGPTVAPYTALISSGITITSTGTPALSGVYAIDAQAQARITGAASYIQNNNKFPNGSATNLAWLQMDGTVVEFPTTVEFLAFADAVAVLVYSATLAEAQAAAMPSAAATIP